MDSRLEQNMTRTLIALHSILLECTVRREPCHRIQSAHIITENEFTYQYRYGFSLSILTALIGSRRNQVINVNPFSQGHRARGGSRTAYGNQSWNETDQIIWVLLLLGIPIYFYFIFIYILLFHSLINHEKEIRGNK